MCAGGSLCYGRGSSAVARLACASYVGTGCSESFASRPARAADVGSGGSAPPPLRTWALAGVGAWRAVCGRQWLYLTRPPGAGALYCRCLAVCIRPARPMWVRALNATMRPACALYVGTGGALHLLREP